MIKRCVVVAVSAALVLSACGGSGGSDVAAFCTRVESFQAKYQKPAGSLTASQIAKAGAELEAIVTIAPKAIKDDMQTLSDVFDIYAQGRRPPAYRSREIQTASENFTKYGEKHCGIKPTTPST